MSGSSHPIAIIGAGPIGLAAAANLIERGMEPLVLEAGASVAASIRDWGHVKLFTPWSFLIDPAGQRLLEAETEWTKPDPDVVPRGVELVEQYLDRVAELDALEGRIHLSHEVLSVSRVGHDRLRDGRRDEAPFLLVVQTDLGGCLREP